MDSSHDSEIPKFELYRLFKKLTDATGQRRRETIDAIIINIINEEWKLIQRVGCGQVLKCLPGHSDLRDDLVQETAYLLFSALIHGRIKYHDQGFHAFLSWLRRLIYRTALAAFHESHSISLDEFVLMDTDQLDNLVLAIDTCVSRDDLLIAISRVKTEKMRGVLQDWALGMSLAESAQKTGHSVTTIWRLRQRGRDELRRELSVD